MKGTYSWVREEISTRGGEKCGSETMLWSKSDTTCPNYIVGSSPLLTQLGPHSEVTHEILGTVVCVMTIAGT